MSKSKLKEKQVLVFENDRYFLNAENRRVFLLKAGRQLKGDNNIEITEEDYQELISKKEDSIQENVSIKNTSISFSSEENISKTTTDIVSAAKNFNSEIIGDFNTVKGMISPITDRIKKDNDIFLQSDSNSQNPIITEKTTTAVLSLIKEAANILPKKMFMKLEQNKKISKMFNLTEKRKNSLNITKVNIVKLQEALILEKTQIKNDVIKHEKRIETLTQNVIDLGNVNISIEKNLNDRNLFIQNLPAPTNQKENDFVKQIIEETSDIEAFLNDVKALVLDTMQHREMCEYQVREANRLFRDFERIDEILIPKMISEYNQYLQNKSINESVKIRSAVQSKLSEMSKENTKLFEKHMEYAAKTRGQNAIAIEDLIERQSSIIKAGIQYQQSFIDSSIAQKAYREKLNVVAKSISEISGKDGETLLENYKNIIAEKQRLE